MLPEGCTTTNGSGFSCIVRAATLATVHAVPGLVGSTTNRSACTVAITGGALARRGRGEVALVDALGGMPCRAGRHTEAQRSAGVDRRVGATSRKHDVGAGVERLDERAGTHHGDHRG